MKKRLVNTIEKKGEVSKNAITGGILWAVIANRLKDTLATKDSLSMEEAAAANKRTKSYKLLFITRPAASIVH